MSRKDYNALAAEIRATLEAWDDGFSHPPVLVLKDAAERIAGVLASDNPRFDRGRFLTACGANLS